MQYIEQLPQESFDAFSSRHPMNSIFQSSAWAATKSNWSSLYTGVQSDSGELIAAALILIRPAAMGFSFAYCPRGPLMDYGDAALVSFYLHHLSQQLKTMKVALLKFDPHLIIRTLEFEEKDQVPEIKDDALVKTICDAGCRFNGYTLLINDSIQPRIQLNYPIDTPFDSRIPHKTMKKVHASYNKGIVIKEEHTADSLEAMVQCTESRHQIRLRNKEYFSSMLEHFGPEAAVLSAYQGTQLVSSCLLVSSTSTTEILYSGYDDAYKHTNSTYPLRYEAIRWASEHGKKNFTFGGVEGTMDDGLTMFKSSFRPQIIIYLGEFDLLTIPGVSSMISRNFRKIRSRISM